MPEEEPQQLCPFCGASWGVCEHHQILVEWEERAEADSRMMRRAGAKASPAQEDETGQPRFLQN